MAAPSATTPRASFSPTRPSTLRTGRSSPALLGSMIGRYISGGMHEDLDITNYGPKPVRFNLEIALRCDFADIFEVKSRHIVRRGRVTTEWSDTEQRLRTTYRNADFYRAIELARAMANLTPSMPTAALVSR